MGDSHYMKNMYRKTWIFFLPLCGLILLSWFLFKGLDHDPRELPSVALGKTLPTFRLPSLLGSKEVEQASLVGQPFLLNVWATWCPSCWAEHPTFLKLKQAGVRIIGLNYKDEELAAKKYLEKNGNPYEEVIVDALGSLVLDLGVYGAPETFFIDAKGVIRYRHVGVIDDRVWEETLKKIYSGML